MKCISIATAVFLVTLATVQAAAITVDRLKDPVKIPVDPNVKDVGVLRRHD